MLSCDIQTVIFVLKTAKV